MKRFTAWMLILLVPALLWAQGTGGPRTRTFIDRVESGSLTVTNTDTQAAYELKHVSFTLTATTLTSAFAIANVVRYKLPDTQTSVVTTNTGISSGAIGYIETNTVYSANSYAQITNSYTVVTTTNDVTAQFYDTDDFPKGWSWEWNDVQTFSFTETNDIDLKRVYDMYPRP